MMKIAIVVEGLFEKSDSIGYDAVAQYKALKSIGCDVRLFSHIFDHNKYPDVSIEFIDRLWQWLKSDKSVVVLYHYCDGWEYFEDNALKLANRLIVRWHNNTPPWFFVKYSLDPVGRTVRGYKRIIKLLENENLEFFVNSEYSKRQLEILGGNPRKIKVVYPISPYLDETKQKPYEKRNFQKKRELTFSFVGRVTAHKGHLHAIAATGLFQRVTRIPVNLSFAGRLDQSLTGYFRDMKNLANVLGVKMDYMGEIDKEDLDDLYAKTDIFLFFSEHEGFGLPVFEAMRAGIPLVPYLSTALSDLIYEHPLALRELDYAKAVVAIHAGLNEEIRDHVIDAQNSIIQKYTYDKVIDQLRAALRVSGETQSDINRTEVGIKHDYLDRLCEEGIYHEIYIRSSSILGGNSIFRNIPRDIANHYVTRHDISSYDTMLKVSHGGNLKEIYPHLVRLKLSKRPLIGPIINFARRLNLSMNAHTVKGLDIVLENIYNVKMEIDNLKNQISETSGDQYSSKLNLFVDENIEGLDSYNWARADILKGKKIWINIKDKHISRNIILAGEWEVNETEFVKKFLKEGDVFVDIGANIGWFTLLAADIVGHKGKVYSFEARPDIYYYLNKSVMDSKFEDIVRTYNFALGDKVSVVNIFDIDQDNPGASSIGRPNEFSGRSWRVRMNFLDNIIGDVRINLIKIDVEGAEMLVFKGAHKILSDECRPVIVSEINPKALERVSGISGNEYIRFMRNYGYKCFELRDGNLGEQINNLESLVPSDIYSVVFLPEGQNS